MDQSSGSKCNELVKDTMDQGECQENRIITLHNLIEENIVADQMLETSSLGATVSAIDSILTKSRDLYAVQDIHSMNSTEFVLDTELLWRNHELMGKVIQYNSNFTNQMFCSAIDGEEDWSALAKFVCNYGKSVFLGTSMSPFLKVELAKEKPPKTRVLRKSKPIAEEKRPKKSDQLEREDGTSNMTASFLKQVKKVCKEQKKPLPYYEAIIDPNDFMDTVANSMHVAALSKENVLALSNGEDGLPQIRPSTSKNPLYPEGFQAISTLSSNLCRKYTNFYDISGPSIKHPDKNT